MTPIRTLIADDEPLARQMLRSMLSGDREIEIVGECGDGRRAIEAIRTLQPDLLFLDIHMPAANGFQVIEAAGSKGAAVVFVTAYDQYAVEAFRAEALDYLLKPFDDLRFTQMLARVKDRMRERVWSQLGQQLSLCSATPSAELRKVLGAVEPARLPLSRILIRARGRMTVLHTNEIDWAQAADNYVELHAGARSYLVRQTVQEFAEQMDPLKFARVHRSAIVNLERVRELVPHIHGEATLVLVNGATVRVSRTRRADVERLLTQLAHV